MMCCFSQMNHGSLFSGIGGFDLAASWMGWSNVWQVEKDAWCRSKLEKNFPETERYEDVRECGKHNLKPVNIITGGFPCQPFSISGRRSGKNDDRYLWPEMFRLISEVKPQWVVAENVPGIFSIENGMVFSAVVSDLESAGYEVQPISLSSAGIGANHVRERVFFMARFNDSTCSPSPVRKYRGEPAEKNQAPKTYKAGGIFSDIDWREWKAKPTLCRKDDGIPRRMDRIKALGNAVDPRVIYRIFKVIDHIDRNFK